MYQIIIRIERKEKLSSTVLEVKKERKYLVGSFKR